MRWTMTTCSCMERAWPVFPWPQGKGWVRRVSGVWPPSKGSPQPTGQPREHSDQSGGAVASGGRRATPQGPWVPQEMWDLGGLTSNLVLL